MTRVDRRRLVVILAFCSLIGLTVFVFPDRVARWFVDKGIAPTVRRTVDVSAERQYKFAADNNAAGFLRTKLKIEYESPIRVDQSASVSAEIRQYYLLDRGPLPPNTSTRDTEPRNTTNEEKALKWTVVLQLSSEAFKFEGADAERQVRANTPLPVTLNWNPTPKAAGNWKVALKLKDLNGTAGSSSAFVNRKGVDDIVEVNMNGKPLVFRGSDDIPINIEVWTEYGLPEIWVKWIGAAFALLTAFMAATAAFYKALGL
jgi:hypothetical protein